MPVGLLLSSNRHHTFTMGFMKKLRQKVIPRHSGVTATGILSSAPTSAHPEALVSQAFLSQVQDDRTESVSDSSGAGGSLWNPTDIDASLRKRPRDSNSTYSQVWSAFKATLLVVKEASVVFPPLQAAVGGLVAVITLLDVRCSIVIA